MRRLLLLRHAKAERTRPGGRDRDRRLTDVGRADAARIGAYLDHHGLVPDRILVSPASRSRETWELAAAAFAPPLPEYDERLYEASASDLLEVIRATEPPVGTLLVVGHNPGLEELAHRLVASGEADIREQLNEGLPTAALAVIDFAVATWDRLHHQSGRLERLIVARELSSATD
jgi:phosphohistidine phosphatase